MYIYIYIHAKCRMIWRDGCTYLTFSPICMIVGHIAMLFIWRCKWYLETQRRICRTLVATCTCPLFLRICQYVQTVCAQSNNVQTETLGPSHSVFSLLQHPQDLKKCIDFFPRRRGSMSIPCHPPEPPESKNGDDLVTWSTGYKRLGICFLTSTSEYPLAIKHSYRKIKQKPFNRWIMDSIL